MARGRGVKGVTEGGPQGGKGGFLNFFFLTKWQTTVKEIMEILLLIQGKAVLR